MYKADCGLPLSLSYPATSLLTSPLLPRSCRHRMLPALRSFNRPRISSSPLSSIAGNMAGSVLLGGHEKKHKVTIVGSGNW